MKYNVMTPKERLFVAVRPTGIAYCDRSRERLGDYVKIGFLAFDDLTLTLYRCPKELEPLVRADAKTMQDRPGESLVVSGAGQMVTLGRLLSKNPKNPAQGY